MLEFIYSSYETNKKYLFAFLVSAVLIFILYTKKLVELPSIAFLIVFLVSLAIVLLPKKKYSILIVMICSGTVLSFITPVLNTPDEPVHLARTMRIVAGQINMDNTKPLITEDFFDVYNQAKTPYTKATLFNESQTDKQVDFQDTTDYRATNSYWFIGYIPQAIGYGIGKFLNLSVGASYYLGRIFNVIAYAILAFIAIFISGKARQLMMLVTMIPMNLVLAASYNQDSVALGLSYILVAMFLNFAINEDKKVAASDFAVYILLCCIMATMKLPYVLLVGLLLFIPREKIKIDNYYPKAFSAILLVGIVTVGWFLLSQQVKIETFKLDGADLNDQLSNLFSKPDLYFPVILREVLLSVNRIDQLFNFGWLDLSMQESVIPIYVLYTLIAVSNIGKFKMSLIPRIGSFLVSLATIGLVAVTLYLTWTPVGDFTVLGVQGRYYLGIFSLLLPAIISIPKKPLLVEDLISDHFVLQSSFIILGLVILHTISMMYTAG